MGSIAIQAEGLGKRYRLGSSAPYKTLRESLPGFFRGAARKVRALGSGRADEENFWALRDVSFEVEHGDVVGVIGRNGAGKSTLLKILSRITLPTEGRALIYGRVGSLLEVGTGFHPELTGRENIFLNGAIMGMRKAEIVSKFDEIVAFAEVDKFVDTPVKHYSSGMYVRLAFAIAAHLEPEILIVDEVLAVGDLAFQQKCLGKMSEVSQEGRTILFVSHNMAVVEKLCQRAIVLQNGRIDFQGDTEEAIHHYMNKMVDANKAEGHTFDLSGATDRRSHIGRLLKRLELYGSDDVPVIEGVRLGSGLKLKVHFDLPRPARSFDVGIGFESMFGQRIFTAHSLFEPDRPSGERVGPQVFVCEIPSFTLMPGLYTIKIWLDINHAEADLINYAARVNVLESDYYGSGKAPWNGAFVLKHNWYVEQPPQLEGEVARAASIGAKSGT
ncbi:MAG TPA: ABC transporter ATP-binding protein [Candidatus Binatia bacterium]|nr:ABC transporter ATP-binding protein [Candidatus Binatia bacterium]